MGRPPRAGKWRDVPERGAMAPRSGTSRDSWEGRGAPYLYGFGGLTVLVSVRVLR